MSLPKLKFIIVSGDIGAKSTLEGKGMNVGGYVVLHTLAKILDSLGMDVKMYISSSDNEITDKDVSEIQNNIFNKFVLNPFSCSTNSELDFDEYSNRWFTQILDGKTLTKGTWTLFDNQFLKIINKFRNKENLFDDDTIVIYSESSPINALSAKNVVHWILADIGNYSGKNLSDTIYRWDKKDLIYHYSSMNNKRVNLLTTSWIDPIFTNNDNFIENKNRTGSCHMYRKFIRDNLDEIKKTNEQFIERKLIEIIKSTSILFIRYLI